jgi:hypothetical protein
MNAAKAVSATFKSASPTPTVILTIRVAGNGAVSAPGGTCTGSRGTKTCTQSYEAGATVVLTATAQTGARFLRWSGGCTGTTATCTLALGAAKTVTATFTASPGAAPGGTLRSRGRPIVQRGNAGFAVILRFITAQQGTAHVRALRAGRIMTAFSFRVAVGPVTIGPFSIAKPGYYTFQVALGSRKLNWTACLGRCGEAAAGRPFTVTREEASVFDAGAVWSVTLHFRATLPADVQLLVFRGTTLALAFQLARPAGRLSLGPFLLSPGNYTLRLRAIDAYGRVRTLTWFALLA